jgi:hypothetical protein
MKSDSLAESGSIALSVEYQLERSDYLAFGEERRRLMPQLLPRIYYFGIIPCLGVGLAVATESLIVAGAFTVLYMVAGWIVYLVNQSVSTRRIYSEDNLRIYVGRWRVTLTNEGLSFVSDASSALYRWPFVREVLRDSRYIHFVLSPLLHAHVPVRAFKDEAEIQAFLKTAKEKSDKRTA